MSADEPTDLRTPTAARALEPDTAEARRRWYVAALLTAERELVELMERGPADVDPDALTQGAIGTSAAATLARLRTALAAHDDPRFAAARN